MTETEGDFDGLSSNRETAPPSATPVPTARYADTGSSTSYAPSPARHEYLDGIDAEAGPAASPLGARNSYLGGVKISSVTRETLVSSPDAPDAPPDNPPPPGSSTLGESPEPPPADSADLSRNWAMLVGQGPTHVETVAKDDALARQAITEALVSLLRNRYTTAPLAIGLFGEWGSGKSSQVNFVKERLSNPAVGAPHVRVVEFNAWEHEKCENLTAALAQTIVEQLIHGTSLTDQWILARQLAAERRAHITAAAQKDRAAIIALFYRWVVPLFSYEAVAALVIISLVFEANYSGWLKGISLGALGLGGWKMLKKYVTDNLTNWFRRIAGGAGGGPFGLPDFAAKLGSFHEIRQTLQHLVSLRVKDGKDGEHWDDPRKGEYLLVVVDDLDRCSVGTIKLVLDAVRLVTNLPRVVTMIAVDDRIAFPAVESYFEQFKGSGRDASIVARDYLAKVFNVSISLPPVPAAMATKFIAERLFADQYRNTAPRSVPDIPTLSAKPEVVPAAPEIPEGTALVTDDEIEEFTRLALEIGMVNPRAMWRMKQAWYLLRNMALSFDPAFSFKPWMRSLFVREAILSLPPAARREIDAWRTSVRNSKSPPPLGDTIPNGLASLLDEDWSDVRRRWHYADIVLLPAAVGAAAI
jgi:hypothetical protein